MTINQRQTGEKNDAQQQLLIAHQFFDQSNKSNTSIEDSKHLREQAKILANMAIEQTANADGYNLLARIALEDGVYLEAERFLDLGLKKQPTNAGLLYSKGHLYLLTQQYHLALTHFTRAEQLAPGETKSAISIAYTLTRQGHFVEAFKAYRRLVRIAPDDDHIRAKLFECTARITADYYDPELEKDLIFFLQLEGADHNALANLIASLLLHKYQALPEYLDEPELQRLAGDVLLLQSLEKIYFTSVAMEQFLKQIRKGLTLFGLAHNKLDAHYLPLLSGLGLHNHANEYVYSYDEHEQGIVLQLKELLEATFTANISAEELALLTLIYTMYEPLTELKNVGVLMSLKISQWPKYAQATLKHCLYDVFSEQVAAKQVAQIGKIADDISLKVQHQYEENPYPRWLHLNFNTPTNYGRALEQELIGFRAPSFFNGEKIRVLIAGCGTGRHALHVAKYFRNVDVTAIDLSKRALAYANKMAKRYGVTNIRFLQADILNLSATDFDQQFHVIECSGVLHHMGEPMVGWQKLKSLLLPNGIMKVGLYSRRAREIISKSRVIIENNQLTAAKNDIRKFRDVVIHSNNEQVFGSVMRSRDFYSLSGCRDMLFHAQEHCFSPAELKRMFKEINMEFTGFILQPAIKQAYRRLYKNDAAMRNLDNWEELEQHNPDMFAGMYQIYCTNKG